jgi:hypothetical protein
MMHLKISEHLGDIVGGGGGGGGGGIVLETGCLSVD